MPSRKQNNQKVFKITNNYVHPSLALREKAPATSGEVSASTVTERINYLRQAQGQHIPASAAFEAARLRSTPPIVPRRRVPGPAPPQSWLERRTIKYGVSNSSKRPMRPIDPTYFPGPELPSQHTLIYHGLKSMARNFDWHVDYDHSYLSVLPPELKELLLSYVACYGPESAMTIRGLKVLFTRGDSDIASSETDEIERLDLGGSAGYGFTLKELEKFLQVKVKVATEANLLDSWELEQSLSSSARFQSLRMLSLANPATDVKWTDLVSVARHFGALTHLSLAYWPRPGLAAGATVSGAGFDSSKHTFDDLDEAYTLKQLARATPSLQYLSLEGCSAWIFALTAVPRAQAPRRQHGRYTDFELPSPTQNEEERGKNTIWTTSWRHLQTLVLGQGWIPQGVSTRFLRQTFETRGNHDFWRIERLASSIIGMSGPTAPRLPALDPPGPTRSFLPAHDNAAPREHEGNTRNIYTVSGPKAVVDSIEVQVLRQEWCRHEFNALRAEKSILGWRREAGQRALTVDFGWCKQDLIDCGYAEEDLFHAGF